jgi:ATP-dependent Clp protease adaptor protein ClpS
MTQEIVEKKPNYGETQPYPNYRVVLLNDSHYSLEQAEFCLTKHIPGMSKERAHQIALKAHSNGSAIVWVGPKEVAELYHDLLKAEGLSVIIEPEG